MEEAIKAKTREELNREMYLDGTGQMKEATDDVAFLDDAALLVKWEEFIKGERPELYERWKAGPRSEGPQSPPETIWPVGYNAEDVVTVYGALRTYLKILSQQPEEDLETIARATRLMIAIKPQAVEASQEIARRNNGTG